MKKAIVQGKFEDVLKEAKKGKNSMIILGRLKDNVLSKNLVLKNVKMKMEGDNVTLSFSLREDELVAIIDVPEDYK